MASDTTTLVLNGNLPSSQFSAAIRHFDGLMRALTTATGPKKKIDWLVDSLEFEDTEADPYPTAKTTLRGEDPDDTAVELVVKAYSNVGRALASGQEVAYSPPVRKAAQCLRSLLNGKIVAMRFETSVDEWTIASPTLQEPRVRPLTAYGAIEGRVETLTRRRGLRFVLYDVHNDRAVSCYLEKGREEMVRDVWGKRAIVEGLISRDPLTGRPTAIRRITAIVVLGEVAPGSFRFAKGILAPQVGDLTPEESIRRMRDAWRA
jgi:hypothetical protein